MTGIVIFRIIGNIRINCGEQMKNGRLRRTMKTTIGGGTIPTTMTRTSTSIPTTMTRRKNTLRRSKTQYSTREWLLPCAASARPQPVTLMTMKTTTMMRTTMGCSTIPMTTMMTTMTFILIPMSTNFGR